MEKAMKLLSDGGMIIPEHIVKEAKKHLRKRDIEIWLG